MDTILVVDDEISFREGVALEVRSLGLAPVLLGSTAEALALLRSGPAPRLVLVDLFMPSADAVAFRRAQLADPAIRNVPVALMVSTPSLRSLAASVGLPILAKPVRAQDLARVLEENRERAGA